MLARGTTFTADEHVASPAHQPAMPTSTTTSSAAAVLEQLGRRVAMAERQVVRRAARQTAKKATRSRKRRWDYLGPPIEEAGRVFKDAITARREDWELGPLAPRRDVWLPGTWPFLEHTPYWGSMGQERATARFKLFDSQLEERCAWAGGSETLCLRVDDRVAVIEGPHKGLISTIAEIFLEHGVLTLRDLKVSLSLPLSPRLAACFPRTLHA